MGSKFVQTIGNVANKLIETYATLVYQHFVDVKIHITFTVVGKATDHSPQLGMPLVRFTRLCAGAVLAAGAPVQSTQRGWFPRVYPAPPPARVHPCIITKITYKPVD